MTSEEGQQQHRQQGGDARTDQIEELALHLYDQCANNHPSDHLFYQQDLIDLGVVTDLGLLLDCTQYLVNQKLLRILQKNDRLAWKVITREDADKYVFFSFSFSFGNTY